MNAYRRLLRLAPAALRARHGAAMEALFRERLDDARTRGRLAVTMVWIAAITDLLASRLRFPGYGSRPHVVHAATAPRRPIMLGSDVRFALRALLRQKLGAGLAVAMLAVGVAANVAVFSLVNGLFLRPLPYPDAGRLVYFNERAPKWSLDVAGVNFPDFHAWRQQQRVMSSMAVWDRSSYNLADGGTAEQMFGLTASHEIADVLGVTPALGRMFTAEEDTPGARDVVVLSHDLWRERFAGSPDVLGRTIRLNGRPYEIIGVLPAHADTYPGNTRFWTPLKGNPASPIQSYSYAGIGRLHAGVTPQDAEADLLRAHQAVWDVRDKERAVSPFVVDLREFSVRTYRSIASILALAVGLLLLIACANVAALMLARALTRRREVGIRLAIGASRLRVLRQLTLESLMLAIAGGVAGLALGQFAIDTLIAVLPGQAPAWARFAMDARVMAFALGMSVVTMLLFGWAPALHAIRGDIRSAMHHVAAGTTASPGGRRTLWALVGAEFALAALLLVCGGLLWRAYDRVRHVDPGFNPDGVLSFTVALPPATYPDDRARLVFWDRLQERLSSTSGVADAALVNCAPLGCQWGIVFEVEGAPPKPSNPVALYRFASSTYLKTMGVRLRAGRFFEARDGRDGAAPRVVVVNDEFVRAVLPAGVDPIGQRIHTDDREPWLTIVGVVDDAKHYGLEEPMRPGVYQPLPIGPRPVMTAVVRATGDPVSVAGAVRLILRQLDAELPLFNLRTMDEAFQQSIAVRTVYSWMLVVFAGMAMLLALSGTYGVTSYLTAQRVREIGIRVALGAERRNIVRAVLGGSLAVVAIGIATGIVISPWVAGQLSELLFGVSPSDLTIITSAAVVLAVMAVAANLVPAWRAAAVDPMTSLRSE